MCFCVSGKGRLFQAAVRHAADLGIVPAFLVADDRADQTVLDFCRSDGVACRRLDAADRSRFDREILELCEKVRPDLITARLRLATFLLQFEDVVLGSFNGSFNRFIQQRLRKQPRPQPTL